jgi:hypothetical protein
LLSIASAASRGPNRFRKPEGVEIRDSIVWISDSCNDRIVKYSFDNQ